MRVVIQRVKEAEVTVEGRSVGRIAKGLLVFLGVAKEDTPRDTEFLANKVIQLRIFEDENGKMNLSAEEAGAAFLVVSQFTLLGDCRKGRRPSFDKAADPQKGQQYYEEFVGILRTAGFEVQTGRFQAMMDVSLVNDGPVTFVLESP